MTMLTETGLRMESLMEMITISNYLEVQPFSKITKLLLWASLVRRSHSNHISSKYSSVSVNMQGCYHSSLFSLRNVFLVTSVWRVRGYRRDSGWVARAQRRGGCVAPDSGGTVRCLNPGWPTWLHPTPSTSPARQFAVEATCYGEENSLCKRSKISGVQRGFCGGPPVPILCPLGAPPPWRDDCFLC